MNWLLGGIVLVAVGVGVRQLLWAGRNSSKRTRGFVPLDLERESIYKQIELEVETQAAILGVSLNDAFEERDANRAEVAWRMVRLSLGEWERLEQLVVALIDAASKQLMQADESLQVRAIAARRFKSAPVVEHVRVHELLDRLVFSRRRRFQLRLRILHDAAQKLTAEFRRTYRYSEQTEDRTREVWKKFDLYFHDFDLVTKESVLAFRDLLAAFPASALPQVATDVEAIVRSGVRAASPQLEWAEEEGASS